MNSHRLESAAAFLDRIAEYLPDRDAFAARSHARLIRDQARKAEDAARELDRLKFAPAGPDEGDQFSVY